MIFFYAIILIVILFATILPLLLPSSEYDKTLFAEQDRNMMLADAKFQKDMIRESLQEVELDLKSQKITEIEYNDIRKEIYSAALSRMDGEKTK